MSEMEKSQVTYLLRQKQLLDAIVAATDRLEELQSSIPSVCSKCKDNIHEQSRARDEEVGDPGTPQGTSNVIVTRHPMTIDEFGSLVMQWLDDTNRTCAIVKFGLTWTHVSNRGDITGAWDTVDMAVAETRCHGYCGQEAFA